MSFETFFSKKAPKGTIPHLENLPVRDFVFVIENLSNFIVTEKVDGTNLVFGFDKEGNFYTSRHQKGGKRYYHVNEYENRAANNSFRSAHAALEENKKYFQRVLGLGEAVEVEVLSGRQPNAIIYGSSQIIFLRMVEGDGGASVTNKVKQLSAVLHNKRTTVTTPQIVTEDGIDLITEDRQQSWKFTSTRFVNSELFKQFQTSRLGELKEFLNTATPFGITNQQIIETNLSTVPTKDRDAIRKERERLTEYVRVNFQFPIKEELLNQVVRRVDSSFRDIDVDLNENLSVEGIVLLNPTTSEQVKIIDRQAFSEVNEFIYSVRNQILNSSKNKESLYSNLKKQLNEVADCNYELISAKGVCMHTITTALNELDNHLKNYKNTWENYYITLKDGRTIKFTSEINERTLIVFAETRQKLLEIHNNIKRARNLSDISEHILSF